MARQAAEEGKETMNPQNTQNPQTALATTPKASALGVLARRYSVEPSKLLETLKATAFKGSTNEQLLALVVVANQYGLNPFLKEIYAFPSKGGGIVPVVGVDGWIAMMNRRPEFDGIQFKFSGAGDDLECEATVHIKGRSKPVVVTEYFSECYRETDPWKTCPKRMLRHKALIQAARIAFGFTGIYDQEEAENGVTIDVSPPQSTQADPLPVSLLPDASETKTEDKPPAGHSMPSWEKLGITIEEVGLTFADFKTWATKGGQVQDIKDAQSWADVPEADAARLLRAKGGMITAIQAAKGGAK